MIEMSNYLVMKRQFYTTDHLKDSQFQLCDGAWLRNKKQFDKQALLVKITWEIGKTIYWLELWQTTPYYNSYEIW